MHLSKQGSNHIIDLDSDVVQLKSAKHDDFNRNAKVPSSAEKIFVGKWSPTKFAAIKGAQNRALEKKELPAAAPGKAVPKQQWPAVEEKRSFWWEVLAYICLPLIIALMALPCVNLIIGVAYEDECPRIPSLTAYLVASGIMGVIAVTRWLFSAVVYRAMKSADYGLYVGEVALIGIADTKISWSKTEIIGKHPTEIAHCNDILLTYSSSMSLVALISVLAFAGLAVLKVDCHPVTFWHEMMSDFGQRKFHLAQLKLNLENSTQKKKRKKRKVLLQQRPSTATSYATHSMHSKSRTQVSDKLNLFPWTSRYDAVETSL